MPYLKFNDSNDKFENYKLELLDTNKVKVIGCIKNNSGFGIYADNDSLLGQYYDYRQDYNDPNVVDDKTFIYTNDGEVFTVKTTFKEILGCELIGDLEQYVLTYEELTIPSCSVLEGYEFNGWNPSIPTSGKIKKDEVFTPSLSMLPIEPTLDELKITKIEEIHATQQQIIDNGIDVELSSGEVCHFNLPEYNQRDLMALQSQVEKGVEKIAWHESDDYVHCRYFSNQDMGKIIDSAFAHVFYHVTYFRDLRMYITKLGTKEQVQAMQYGVVIPEEYRGEVMNDLYQAIMAQQ